MPGYHLPEALIVGGIPMVRAFLLPSSTAVGSCCQHIEKSIGILTGFVKLYETMEPTSKQSLNSNCTCGSNAAGAKLGLK